MVSNEESSNRHVEMVRFVDNTVKSIDIFANGNEVTILHDDAQYKLRLTGNGKLILTK